MAASDRRWTVVALLAALFMGALEGTVVATVMPTVVGELGGLDRYSWVFTAYLVASTVTVPVWGKLADQFGRKPVALVGTTLFVVGSAASGAAGSMTQLIGFRALQGLGAGAAQPMALTIVGDLYSVEERGRIQALFGSVWAISGILGPLVGGLVVEHLSWRWVFTFNVPVGLFSMAVLWRSFHEAVERRPHRVDFLGAGLLAAVVVTLLVAAHGGTVGWLAALAAVTLGGALLKLESRVPEPIVPLALFRRRFMWISTLASVLVGGAMFSCTTYTPLLVQACLHGTPTQAGAAIAPLVVGWPLAAAVAGRAIVRVGFRPLIRVGLVVAAASVAGLAWAASAAPSLETLGAASAFLGVGLGLATTAMMIAVQSAVPWEERGAATGWSLFARTTGGSLLVGVLGAILTRAVARIPGVPAGAADELLGPRGHAIDPSIAARLGATIEEALHHILWITAAVSALAMLVGFGFPAIRWTPAARPAGSNERP